MKKISIIIQREYLSRVKKRSFILTTLGLPLLMVGFSVLIGFIGAKSKSNMQYAVVDESKIFENQLADSTDKHTTFSYFAKLELDSLRANYAAKKFDALLHIAPPNVKGVFEKQNIKVYSTTNVSSDAANYLENRINTVFQNKIMTDAGMNRAEIDSINNISLSFSNITKDDTQANAQIASGIGYFSGFLIYIVLFIYGSMVMRGVMEEKTNRIAEVIISSVKPFELMMGKVLGIALVGLTQFVIWIAFIGILSAIAGAFLPSLAGGMASLPTAGMPAGAMAPPSSEMAAQLLKLTTLPWTKIALCFLFYFMGGYLLYASLFAAVGSMVNEDIADAQSLTLPIMMPIIVGFTIAVQASGDPNSGLAIFGSIFPLTSPIVMMSRIAYNPPMWQVLLSMVLLITTFIITIWLSGKIYRTGILMYGKKSGWKEALKWIRIK